MPTDWLPTILSLLFVGFVLIALYLRMMKQRRRRLRAAQHEQPAAPHPQFQEQIARLGEQCAHLQRGLEEQAAHFHQLLAEQEARWRVVSRALVLALGDYPNLDAFLDQLALLVQEIMHYDQFGIGLIDATGKSVYRAGYGVPDEWKGRLALAPARALSAGSCSTASRSWCPTCSRTRAT